MVDATRWLHEVWIVLPRGLRSIEMQSVTPSLDRQELDLLPPGSQKQPVWRVGLLESAKVSADGVGGKGMISYCTIPNEAGSRRSVLHSSNGICILDQKPDHL